MCGTRIQLTATVLRKELNTANATFSDTQCTEAQKSTTAVPVLVTEASPSVP